MEADPASTVDRSGSPADRALLGRERAASRDSARSRGGTEFQRSIWEAARRIRTAPPFRTSAWRDSRGTRAPRARSATPWAPTRSDRRSLPPDHPRRRSIGGFSSGSPGSVSFSSWNAAAGATDEAPQAVPVPAMKRPTRDVGRRRARGPSLARMPPVSATIWPSSAASARTRCAPMSWTSTSTIAFLWGGGSATSRRSGPATSRSTSPAPGGPPRRSHGRSRRSAAFTSSLRRRDWQRRTPRSRSRRHAARGASDVLDARQVEALLEAPRGEAPAAARDRALLR